MTTTSPPANWNAADFWRPWLQLAPSSLVQPLFTGWTFNINSNNSTAPQTEVDVTARHSYGRQIGRMADALRALLLHGDPAWRKEKPMAEFLSMWEEVEAVKTHSAAARLAQLAADVARLKVEDAKAYEGLRRTLLRVLEAP
jgi:hypothetical protein